MIHAIAIVAAGSSRNGRVYRADPLESALHRFDGVAVEGGADLAHGDVRAVLGHVRRPRLRWYADTEGRRRQGIVALFDVLAGAEEIVEKARRVGCGFSIEWRGVVREGEVQRIRVVESVRLVGDPAAGGAFLAPAEEERFLLDLAVDLACEGSRG